MFGKTIILNELLPDYFKFQQKWNQKGSIIQILS